MKVLVMMMVLVANVYGNECGIEAKKQLTANTGAVSVSFIGDYSCNEGEKCERFMIIDNEGNKQVEEYLNDGCEYNNGYAASEM